MTVKDCIQKAIDEGHNEPDYKGVWLAKSKHYPKYSMPVLYTMMEFFGPTAWLNCWLEEHTHITFIHRVIVTNPINDEELGVAIIWYNGEPLGILKIELRHDGIHYWCDYNRPVVAKLLLSYTNLHKSFFDNGCVKNAWQDTEISR